MSRRPRVYKTEAIVLRRTKLGEADRILTLLTPNLGKVRAVAKGVRRPGSRLGGHVETLTYSAMLLARGRQLDIVTQSQTVDAFLPLRRTLERTSAALYACELTDSFTLEREECYPLFHLLLETLRWLCVTRSPAVTLRWFELSLLARVGYRPELSQCVSCAGKLDPLPNAFSPSSGGVLCPDCSAGYAPAQRLSVDALKALRYLQQASAQEAQRLRLEGPLAQELEKTLRDYLQHLLEREVNSARFLDDVGRQPQRRRPREQSSVA